MPLDFTTLTTRIERLVEMIRREYSRVPGSILTEDDLKCILHRKLSAMSALRGPAPTLNPHILGSHVHAELSWYDEHGRLRIRPDLTIVEPEHMSILHGHGGPVLDPFCGAGASFYGAPPLPSKQCSFGGKAVILELKFARAGITKAVLGHVRKDLDKILGLLDNLERAGEGQSVYAFLIVFNKLPQRLRDTPLAELLSEYGEGPRYKVLYKARCTGPAPWLQSGRFSAGIDFILTSSPYYGGGKTRRGSGRS
jgi:hypothetical protein